MRLSLRLSTTILAIAAMCACGGGNSSSGSTTAPTTATTTTAPSTTPTPTPTPTPAPTPAPATTFTISIVGSSGTGAFSPNPSTVASGSLVVWKNNDSTTHHIVMDNGSADLGNVAPGASTTATAIASGSFHCTIHPTMVGSISGSLPTVTMPDPVDPNYPTSRRK